MGVYLRAKFQDSNIILTSFRQEEGDFTQTPTLTSKQAPKKPTTIRNNRQAEDSLKNYIIHQISTFVNIGCLQNCVLLRIL